MSVFFAVLVGLAVLGGYGLFEAKNTENDEMRRLAEEKRQLQERLLGRKLSRTLEAEKTSGE